MNRPKSDYAIQTVTNALRLLEAFEHDDELGVTELARRLNLHKNNVFRLLATLVEAGYIGQTPSDRYRLGVACLQLGQRYARNHGLVRRAAPVLEALAHRTGETTHLGVLRGFDVVHVAGAQSDGNVITGLRVGRPLPGFCTALGKVLIACDAPARLEQFDREVIEADRVAARTERTIVDPEKLVEHLRGVASRGWATDLEECEEGLACVAAPVHDASGRLAGAISVSAPAFRAAPAALEERVLPAVSDAARSLSRELGYS